MRTIAVVGTFDTKGAEHAFVAECIRERGLAPLLIDVGTASRPTITPDISREEVLESASQVLALESADRGEAVRIMSESIGILLSDLASQHRIDGVISLGGTGGTAIGTAGMRVLPLGLPKVMVSTVASGNVATYVGIKDIVMFPSLVDVSGLNRVSRRVLTQAAAAVCAMAEANEPSIIPKSDRPLVVASMFGNTTRCVEHARKLLEEQGFEVLVFHATGVGGRTMEALIETGIVDGVLDITTTEWADELVGGVMSGGPTRLEAAARRGVPAVVAPGCLDMVNFGPPETVPSKYHGRLFHQHNPQVTLMRTTPEECEQLGRVIASKLNQSIGPIRVLYPLNAISVISAPGQPFHCPASDRALLESLKTSLRRDIPFDEMECEINDPAFAACCTSTLLDLIRKKEASPRPEATCP